MNCMQVEELLSAYYDDELSLESHASLTEHIKGCPTCAARLEEFQRLASLTAQLQDPAPPAYLWPELERQLDTAARPSLANLSSIWRHKTSRLAAIAAVLAIGVAIGLLMVRTQASNPYQQLIVQMERYFDHFATNPDEAQRELTNYYNGRSVDIAEATRLVGYRPLAPKRLPQGYALDALRILDTKCCVCVQATYKCNDSSTLVIFEHGTDQHGIDEHVCLGNRPMVNCLCNGKLTSIVQVDDKIAAGWKQGKSYITLVGARNVEQVAEVMAYLGAGNQVD